jgi:hypothetical protein
LRMEVARGELGLVIQFRHKLVVDYDPTTRSSRPPPKSD